MTNRQLDPWQYRLSTERSLGARAVGELWLDVGPDLPVTEVTDAEGLSVGLILGFPIDLLEKAMMRETWSVPIKLGTDHDSFASAVLNSLGGRFLWVYSAKDVTRIYPDCSAQVTCVFDPSARNAGSTAFALLDSDEYERRFDRATFSRLNIDGEGWFPAGLTAHQGLYRLLPSHYLDLNRWEALRFWPKSTLPTLEDPEAAVEKIIFIIQSQMEALAAQPKRLALALTAGLDTRTLLACSRPYLGKIDLVTVTGSDRHEIDTIMAQRIAKDLGLNHIALPRVVASDDERARFILRGGHCHGDSNSTFHPSVWPLSESHLFVGGAGGGISRLPIMRDHDNDQTTITPDFIINRFGLPRVEKVEAAFESRLSNMIGISSLQKLDLFFQEDRYAPWYGAQFCCDPKLVRYAPLLTTESVELMMRFPRDWRQNGRIFHRIIQRLWPELEGYPVNSLGIWKDTLVKIERTILDPKLIMKKIRKMRS